MVFTSVLGHIMEIDFAPPYNDWNSVDPIELFDAPIQKKVAEKHKPVADNLKVEARQCDTLILWLDCDREGEAISYEVLEIVKGVKSNINVARAHFSALIPG